MSIHSRTKLGCPHEWVPGKRVCEICGGTGKVTCLVCKEIPKVPHTHSCKRGRRRCENCRGVGVVGAMARCSLPRCGAEIPATGLSSLDKPL